MIVNVLELKATGWPSCMITAPRPDSEASHCNVTSLVLSKYLRTGSFVIGCFTWCSAVSCASSQCHSTSLSSRHLNDSVTSERVWKKVDDHSGPSSLCNYCLWAGVGIFKIAFTLFGSGFKPFGDSKWPMYGTSYFLNSNFFGLSLMFFSRQCSRRAIKFLSWFWTALS